MKPIDFAKAAGVAIAILAINVLIVILAVTVYAMLIKPGHPSAFYDEAAKWIAPWCTRTVGVALFFITGYFLTVRQPERNGLLYAAVFSFWYVLIDAAMVGFVGVVNVEFAMSMLANLLAALVGAYVAARAAVRPSASERESIDKHSATA